VAVPKTYAGAKPCPRKPVRGARAAPLARADGHTRRAQRLARSRADSQAREALSATDESAIGHARESHAQASDCRTDYHDGRADGVSAR